jgi:hypothetical protein
MTWEFAGDVVPLGVNREQAMMAKINAVATAIFIYVFILASVYDLKDGTSELH